MNNNEFALWKLDRPTTLNHPKYKITRNNQDFCYANNVHTAMTGVMAVLSSEGKVKPVDSDV